MAIVRNMWMRNTRKQVAGAVLYNLKGQTIQREKAASVANPRTTAQMDQRVKLANLVNFYRANKAWMAKGAFESKKQTWSDYNAFVSANLNGNEVYLTKELANSGVCAIAPYIVTKGSLPEANVTASTGNVYLSVDATTAPTTFGALSTALIAKYPGLQNGDQMSIILYRVNNDGDGWPHMNVSAIEINLDTTSTATIATAIPGASYADDALVIATDAAGASICFSRTVNGSIKVSPSDVKIINDESFALLSSDSALANAIASYGGSSVNFLDNGTTGLSSSAGDSQSGGGSGSGDPGDVTP